MECPACGCEGGFTGHGRYVRTVVYRGREERVSIRRVRCTGCRATHAVLPEGIVPYRSYSEMFVIAVLAAWVSGASNSDVRRIFGISETTRRRILSDSRSRACALLACGASRAAVAAALASAGVGAVTTMHLTAYGTRFTENTRPPRLRGRPVDAPPT